MLGTPQIEEIALLNRGPYTFAKVSAIAENDDPALGHFKVDMRIPFIWGFIYITPSSLFRLKDETSDVPACSFACGSVLDSEPANVAKVAHLRTEARKQHQHPLIDWIYQDHALTLLLLRNGFPNPCCRAFFAALMNNRTEWRVDIVRRAPLAGKAVEPIW